MAPWRSIGRGPAWLIALGVVLALAMVALYGPPQKWARERTHESTFARKSASVAMLKERHPSREALLGAVAEKTELLFGDCKAVAFKEIEGGGISIVPERESGQCKFVAAVVPATGDGYFLTAAHAIAGTSQVIVAMTRDGGHVRARSASARVVWTRPDPRLHPDLALLHADLGLVDPFEMAEAPSPGDLIILTGSGGDRATAAGGVLSLREIAAGQDGSAFQLVRHNAPSMKGDSGGALVDLQGRLIGINADIHPPSWLGWLPSIGSRISYLTGGAGSYSQAVRPDPDWLAGLIEADRGRVAAE